MNVGDRVKHKKYGLGTVKTLYAKYDAARIEYDDGKVSTNAQKKLAVVPADFTEAKPTAAPTAPSRVTRSQSSGTARIDYPLLERAREYISGLHPDAEHVIPRIYNGKPYCEVWVKGGGADIVFYEEH